jgi:hypothetical protein
MVVGYLVFLTLRAQLTLQRRRLAISGRGICTVDVLDRLRNLVHDPAERGGLCDLQLGAAVDLGVLIVIMLLAGGMVSAGELRWSIPMPSIGQIIDVYQSVLIGINNAAEKPYVPNKGSA